MNLYELIGNSGYYICLFVKMENKAVNSLALISEQVGSMNGWMSPNTLLPTNYD